jgi:ABC-type oligopeptide transport system substrate-binding subunit
MIKKKKLWLFHWGLLTTLVGNDWTSYGWGTSHKSIQQGRKKKSNYFINSSSLLPATNNRKTATTGRVSFLRRLTQDTQPRITGVNPDAPKRGTIQLSEVGSWDSFNPFIVLGIAGYGISTLTMGTLMVRNQDTIHEPFTLHCWIAKEVEMAKDYSSITFYLRPEARFHNGKPVKAQDVEASIRTLESKGLPRYSHHYGKIAAIKIIDDHTIRIDFKPSETDEKGHNVYNPEAPLIIAMAVVMEKAQLDQIDFWQTKEPLIGCGPYCLNMKETKIGERIVYKRVSKDWSSAVPAFKGMWNFSKIVIDYCKTLQTQFQMFLCGQNDVFFETNPDAWEKNYDVPAVRDGRIKRLAMKHHRPVAIKTILFNMNDPKFHSWEVRRALTLALDFQKQNTMFFKKTMEYPTSMFANTILSPKGKPNPSEINIYDQLRYPLTPQMRAIVNANDMKLIHDETIDHTPKIKKSHQKEAIELLKKAGYILENGYFLDKNNKKLSFSIIIWDPKLEKLASSYQQDLKAIGVDLQIRRIERVQYEELVSNRNFCMIFHTCVNSMSPGNEQAYFFSVEKANVNGSSNYGAVKDKTAEELAKKIPMATTQKELISYVHAFDRYIYAQHYQILLNYDPWLRLGYWKDHVDFVPIDEGTNFQLFTNAWRP